MASSTRVVHHTCDPFRTVWPGWLHVHLVLLVSAYLSTEFFNSNLTDFLIMSSTSFIQSSTFFSLGFTWSTKSTFYFSAEYMAVMCFLWSNSIACMFSNTFFRWGWTAVGSLV